MLSPYSLAVSPEILRSKQVQLLKKKCSAYPILRYKISVRLKILISSNNEAVDIYLPCQVTISRKIVHLGQLKLIINHWTFYKLTFAICSISADKLQVVLGLSVSGVELQAKVREDLTERAFSCFLKVPTSAFTFKTLLGQNRLNTVSRHENGTLANQPCCPLWPLRRHPDFMSTYCGLMPV